MSSKSSLTLSHFFGVTPETASIEQFYKAVAMIVRDELAAMNSDFRHTAEKQDSKKSPSYPQPSLQN